MIGEKDEKEFAEINAKVRKTLDTCLTYILKWAYFLESVTREKGGFGSIENQRFTLLHDDTGTNVLSAYINELSTAISLYEKYYNKGISLSKTWKKFKTQEKTNSVFGLNFDDTFLDFIKNVKFKDDAANASMENIKKLYETLDNFFTVDKSKITTEKYFNEAKSLRNTLKGIKIENIEEAEIDTETKIKIPTSIDSDGSIDDANATIKGYSLSEFLAECKTNNGKIIVVPKDGDSEEELDEDDIEKLKELIEKTSKDEFTKYVEEHKDDEEIQNKISEIKKICDISTDENSDEEPFSEEEWIEILKNSTAEGYKVNEDNGTKSINNLKVLGKDKADLGQTGGVSSEESTEDLMKDPLFARMAKTNEKYPDIYKKFKENYKDKEEKAGIIFALDKLFGGQQEENKETEIPQEIVQHTKTTADEITDIISNIDDDNVEQQLEKINNMATKTEDEMEKFMGTKDDNGNDTGNKSSFEKEWNSTFDILKDFEKDPFATIWAYKFLMSKKYESFNRFNRNMLLNLLTEDEQPQQNNQNTENQNDQTGKTNDGNNSENNAENQEANKKKEEFINSVKEEIQKLPKLFEMDTPEKFAESYKNFAGIINDKIKSIIDGENTSDETKKKLSELKDDKPFARAIKFYKIISAKQGDNENDNKQENQNGENSQETQNQTESILNHKFHDSFKKYILESLK